jgi:hypothetical protein
VLLELEDRGAALRRGEGKCWTRRDRVRVARRYGVTRQSLHDWLKRYPERRMAGLVDRSKTLLPPGLSLWDPRKLDADR